MKYESDIDAETALNDLRRAANFLAQQIDNDNAQEHACDILSVISFLVEEIAALDKTGKLV